MTRKNLRADLTKKKGLAARSEGRGALGAVRRTIDDLVVELDPGIVDRSFITDRMEEDDETYRALRDSIAAKGQDSPILVRPHPVAPGRYQVAFGHRRLRAAADLGRTVRAIVRPMSDRDLVITQGQENSARTDLSFIERGRFAQALEEGGYDRETIMQALTIDKTGLSRLISVVNRLPTDIVEAIGPAPAAGRDRWIELAAVFSERVIDRPIDPLLESEEFTTAASDARFQMLLQHLAKVEAKPPEAARVRAPVQPPRVALKPRDWVFRTGAKVATVTVNEVAFVLTIDKAVAKDFGEFLLTRMGSLYEEYLTGPPKKVPYHHSIQR